MNPDNEQERVPALAFELTEGRFLWRGETALIAAALLVPDGDGTESSTLAEAVDFLREALAKGARPAKEVEQEAVSLSIVPKTLRRAKERLGVTWRRQGEPGRQSGGAVLWSLPKGLLAHETHMGNKTAVVSEIAPGPRDDGQANPHGDNGLPPTDGPLVQFAVQQIALPTGGHQPHHEWARMRLRLGRPVVGRRSRRFCSDACRKRFTKSSTSLQTAPPRGRGGRESRTQDEPATTTPDVRVTDTEPRPADCSGCWSLMPRLEGPLQVTAYFRECVPGG